MPAATLPLASEPPPQPLRTQALAGSVPASGGSSSRAPCLAHPLTSLLRSSRTSTNLAGNQPGGEAGSCEGPSVLTLPPMGLRTSSASSWRGQGGGRSLTAQPAAPRWGPRPHLSGHSAPPPSSARPSGKRSAEGKSRAGPSCHAQCLVHHLVSSLARPRWETLSRWRA